MDAVTVIVYATLALIAAMIGIGIFVGFVLCMRIALGVGRILIPTSGIMKAEEPEEKKPNTYLRMSQEP